MGEYRGNVNTPDIDSLQHWKYIRRERRNGKWVYYYKEDDGKTTSSRYDPLKKQLGYAAKEEARDAVNKYNHAQENSDGYEAIKDRPEQTKWYNDRKSESLKKEAAIAERKALKAVKKYSSTPLSKVDSAIDKGRKAVSKVLNKLANKIAPKDDSLDYAIKKNKLGNR